MTWTGITPTPGSYAIERAVGAVGSEGLYQPLAFVPGSSSSFIDTTVQGGVTYTYRVIAATDAAGRCQALVRSGGASATATGSCNLEPIFAGVTSATSLDGPVCGITVNWSPGSVKLPVQTAQIQHLSRNGARLRAVGGQPDCQLRSGSQLLSRHRQSYQRHHLPLRGARGGRHARAAAAPAAVTKNPTTSISPAPPTVPARRPRPAPGWMAAVTLPPSCGSTPPEPATLPIRPGES